MKTNNQVEVIIFRHPSPETTEFLMLKRNLERGGFWQPVTGGVESGESFEDAAAREVKEELGIEKLNKLIDIGFTFQFEVSGETKTEYVFGGLVSNDQAVILSNEYTEYKWVTFDQAINDFLKYPGNKEGFKKLKSILDT